MKPYLLIVDGHSVIFAWPELRQLHARRTALAREELVSLLTRYQDQSGHRAVVVFDGSGPKLTEECVRGGAKVFYAPAGKTADEIVERLVVKYAETWEVTVATCDRMEQQTAITFGARSIDAEGLRREIAQADNHFDDELKRYRRK